MNLVGMVIKEVSLVDRPANKKKFLLYKRDNSGGAPMKLTKENIAKMSPEDIKKYALDIVEAQDTLEKAVGEFEGKVAKAVSDNKTAVESIVKSKAAIATLAKEAIVQIAQAAGGVGAAEDDVMGLKPQVVDQPTHKCLNKACKGIMLKAEAGKEDDDMECPKCGGKMEKVVAPIPAVHGQDDLADSNPVKVLTAKIDTLSKGIKERDEVIADLTGLVDQLQKSIITKADVDAMLKEALGKYRQGIK